MTQIAIHPNKVLVRRLLDAYEQNDLHTIRSIVSEKVVFEVVGKFRVEGKYEYIQHLFEIKFREPPNIIIQKETAEDDGVSMEGQVVANFIDGTAFKARFHNAYQFKEGLLVAQTSYIIPVK